MPEYKFKFYHVEIPEQIYTLQYHIHINDEDKDIATVSWIDHRTLDIECTLYKREEVEEFLAEGSWIKIGEEL